ncbi:GNAT family N-acetyltransferase [Agreia pratensis]|uniref:Protein N-acetyltransferase, RimJ/RimL family n=1 Tax=Agreia pratensis TaxID=150121 RepID=A0A1X7J063_9MICO|nr:GNAT family protein [Agreia pratensis]SMG20552.1 Protein N-acetyltransferase, RimJ/RimL family [Agreia pratensis]
MSGEAVLRVTEPVRTEHLLLRTLTPDDLDDVFAYAGRDDVIRYLPWPKRNRDEVAEHLARRLNTTLATDGDVIVLGMELAPSADDPAARPRIIGDMTLVLSSVEHRQATIGWVLNPEYEGKGYATEAASRVLTLAFDELGSHRVIAELDPRNTASAALCARLGMRLEAHFVHSEIFKGEWGDLAVYAILDVEWNARNALDG